MRTVHNASMKKEDTNVFVQAECRVIRTKKDAFRVEYLRQANVKPTVIALILWLVCKAIALARARVYSVVKMHIANRKIMPPGVDAASVLKKTKAANVFHVSISLHFSIFFNTQFSINY